MTRRLKLAGLGLCALVFPACSASDNFNPYYSAQNPGVAVLDGSRNANALYPPTSQQQPGYSPYRGGAFTSDPRFQTLETPNMQSATPTPTPTQPAPPVQIPGQPNVITVTEQPARLATPTAARQQILIPDAMATAKKQPPPLDAVQPPVVVPPTITQISASKNTYVPNEPLKAPPWPSFGTPIADSTNSTPRPLPKIDEPLLQPTVPSAQTPIVNPPQPGVPGPQTQIFNPPQQDNSAVSMKIVEPNGQVVMPVEGSAAVVPPVLANETHLVRAIKAFQSNRPEEAAEQLKQIDSSNQELMMILVQITARLGEGNVNALTPEELAKLVDRLQAVSGILRSKASLRTDRVCFCRNVRKFADVESYEPNHEFHPRETVFLYAELKNYTCEPVNVAQHPGSPTGTQRAYSIRLGATLELWDNRSKVVWRTDLHKNDFAQTPPQDYYHTYRFSVPDRLPPGVYTLWLSVIDKPSGRIVRTPIEMRVGQG